MEKKPKIIVLGGHGMLGHVLVSKLKSNHYSTISLVRGLQIFDNEVLCDVSDFNQLESILVNEKPDYVINCVGVLVKNSIENPDNAILINSYLPHLLDKLSLKHSFKFIHISTDCVFNGTNGPYNEISLKNETNYYGLSKNLGELNNSRSLTIRTSIIGPELKENGTGLFNWFLKTNEDQIFGYANTFWSGLTTIELSEFIIYILKGEINLNGLIHATNNVSITKLELLKLFNDEFSLNKKIIADHKEISNKVLLNTNKKIKYEFPDYKKMIADLKIWMKNNESMYFKIYPSINND